MSRVDFQCIGDERHDIHGVQRLGSRMNYEVLHAVTALHPHPPQFVVNADVWHIVGAVTFARARRQCGISSLCRSISH
eukprot:10617247-Karenia_brevis.AAC.1